MNTSKDKQLLESVACGNHIAFRALFDRFYPQTFAFLKSFLHTADDAADVAQEVFVKIWTMRTILTEIHDIQRYIYRMTVNSALNFARDRKQYADVFAMDIPDEQMVEELIDTQEKKQRLTSVVRSMPEQRRKVFVMSRFELMPIKDIALCLGLSKKTVENHLNLALKEIRNSGIF